MAWMAAATLKLATTAHTVSDPAQRWPGSVMVLDVGLWVMTGYLFLGVLMNAISRSKPERNVMTPVALVLAVCFLVVAVS